MGISIAKFKTKINDECETGDKGELMIKYNVFFLKLEKIMNEHNIKSIDGLIETM